MTTDYNKILKQIDKINPVKYSKDRNFIDGSVSKLSPYISRGVISTKFVYDYLIKKGYTLNKILKFVQELVWREYWQHTWNNYNINNDLKNTQKDVLHYGIPSKVIEHSTKINAIDHSIVELYKTGYMHNHLRMYLASLTTNIAKYHWRIPAKWMYYHLLDADWGSNALSWQWVCGANSHKKYYANQQNINKFTKTNQTNTILDCSYEDLININKHQDYSENMNLNLTTIFPESEILKIDSNKPICIYNFYNLDSNWRNDLDANRILLIEPSVFKKYPIGEKSMKFMLDLSRNINKIKVIVGEFNELPIKNSKVYFKEHPLNYNYKGIKDQREWICKVEKPFKSFFKHWNYVLKEIAFK